MLQGKQQAVYGDAAQCTSSPGQPDGWTQIKNKHCSASEVVMGTGKDLDGQIKIQR